jgi:hypothetical protein
VFFPRSAEANEALAQILRTQADSQAKLDHVETLLKKAVAYTKSEAEGKCAIAGSGAGSGNGNGSTNNGKSEPGKDSGISMGDSMDEDLLEREQQAAIAARRALGILLCQAGRLHEAAQVLRAGGFTWRVSNKVPTGFVFIFKPIMPPTDLSTNGLSLVCFVVPVPVGSTYRVT